MSSIPRQWVTEAVARLWPSAPLARVQLSLLGVVVLAGTAVFVLALVGPSGPAVSTVPAVSAVPAGSVGLLMALWWRGFRRGGFPWPFLALEAVLLFAGVAMQGTSGGVTALATAALFFRSSFGSAWSTLAVLLTWTTAITAALVLATVADLQPAEPYAARDAVIVLWQLALLATPVRIVVVVLERYELVVARERALLSAGTALVATGSADEVGAVAVRAAESLVDGAGATVRWLDGELLDERAGDVLVLVPGDKGKHRGALELRSQHSHVLVMIVAADDHRPLLVVETPEALAPSVVRALSALAATLALGLRSATAAHRLRRQALEDPLTGLANRALLEARLSEAADAAQLPGGNSSVLMLIDLDGFKEVNDGLGHAAGDTVLVTVADRLRACARPGDVVARLGGDEFVVLLEHVSSEEDVRVIAERLVLALSLPVDVGGAAASVTGSIGVARLSAGVPAAAALAAADAAMYAAKAAGKATYVLAPPVSPKVRASAVG